MRQRCGVGARLTSSSVARKAANIKAHRGRFAWSHLRPDNHAAGAARRLFERHALDPRLDRTAKNG